MMSDKTNHIDSKAIQSTELRRSEVFIENGELYLSITYAIYTLTSVYEFTYPRIVLPFNNSVPLIDGEAWPYSKDRGLLSNGVPFIAQPNDNGEYYILKWKGGRKNEE